MRNSQKIRELHDKKYQEKIEQAQLAEEFVYFIVLRKIISKYLVFLLLPQYKREVL